jgi:hypothetical protein
MPSGWNFNVSFSVGTPPHLGSYQSTEILTLSGSASAPDGGSYSVALPGDAGAGQGSLDLMLDGIAPVSGEYVLRGTADVTLANDDPGVGEQVTLDVEFGH